MPLTVRPDLPAQVERAIDVVGNRVRVAALRSLTSEGPTTATELARRLDVSGPLVRKHLVALENLGVVVTTPPRREPGRLRRTYSVAPRVLQELLTELAEALRDNSAT